MAGAWRRLGKAKHQVLFDSLIRRSILGGANVWEKRHKKIKHHGLAALIRTYFSFSQGIGWILDRGRYLEVGHNR